MTAISLELVARDAHRAVERGDVTIVIDVLRCSSSIVAALANGAEAITPVETVREARMLKEEDAELVLAGERRGLKPRGFALGNSPLGFSRERVAGSRIAMTTTSGTKAITKARGARWVFIGALLNVKAVCKRALDVAKKEKRGVSLVLSGKKGSFSLEDFLCAGAFVEAFSPRRAECSDAAYAAYLAFRLSKGSLLRTVQRGSHARYLESIGLGPDVAFCCQLDAYSIIPYLKDGLIVADLS